MDTSSGEGAIRWAVRCFDMMAHPEEFDRSSKAIRKMLDSSSVKPSMVGRRGACVDYVRASDSGPEVITVGEATWHGYITRHHASNVQLLY